MNTLDSDDLPAPAAPRTTIRQSTLSLLWKFFDVTADDMPGDNLAEVLDLRGPVGCNVAEDGPPEDIVALETPG